MKKQMNYSLKQLKVFVTVAQEKSFSRAGERIGLSQSAVSHSEGTENHTGVRLWTEPRGSGAPDAGQQLALRERLLDELNSTLRDTAYGGTTERKSSGRCQPDHFRASSQCIAENLAAIQIFSLSCTIVRSSNGKYRREMSILASTIDPAQWAICNVKRFFPSLSFCFAIAIALWPWKIMYPGRHYRERNWCCRITRQAADRSLTQRWRAMVFMRILCRRLDMRRRCSRC